ncbi:MAG: MFS transporter [Opitutaceae bacterium]|nr:MFS transporter [Opitutaceae bacterium]
MSAEKPGENLFANLALNIAAPALALSKLSAPERLGPLPAMFVALAFPVGYFIWDLARRREASVIAVIGAAGVLLTGVLGALKTDVFWFAVKEASIPALIAVALLLTLRSERSLMRTLFFNGQLIDTERVNAALDARGRRGDFERLLTRSGLWLVGSFALSAALNFWLARLLLTAPAGSEAFNGQLSRMFWMGWLVIVPPSTGMALFALWRLFGGVAKLSGLGFEQILRERGGRKTAGGDKPPQAG